jgi:hypothetical protein
VELTEGTLDYGKLVNAIDDAGMVAGIRNTTALALHAMLILMITDGHVRVHVLMLRDAHGLCT